MLSHLRKMLHNSVMKNLVKALRCISYHDLEALVRMTASSSPLSLTDPRSRVTCFCSMQKPSDRLTEPTSPTISPGPHMECIFPRHNSLRPTLLPLYQRCPR